MIDARISPERIVASEATEVEILLSNTWPGTCTNVVFTVRLPIGIIRLQGREKIQLERLEAGQHAALRLRVRADGPGRYTFTSSNFSYRDHLGQVHRISDFAAELIAEAAGEPPSRPRVDIAVQTERLSRNEWSALRFKIINGGAVSVADLVVSISGPFRTDPRAGSSQVKALAPGASADLSISVRADEAGAAVPVHFDLAYSGPAGRNRASTTTTIAVAVGRRSQPHAERGAQLRILMLWANPRDTRWLRLGEEARRIQQAIRDRNPDTVRVEVWPAVRAEDIVQALLDFNPHMVHLAGHGADGTFVAEDDHGLEAQLPPEPLALLLSATAKELRCVTVNACSTERLARELVKHVPYVVAMRQEVLDYVAIQFSIAFYRAIVAGLAIDNSFDVGKAAMGLANEDHLETPILLRRSDSPLVGD